MDARDDPETRAGPADPEPSDASDELDADADLDAREAERIRRRDRESEAEQRELLRPGMGKVFKQIQDAQRKAADEPAPRRGPAKRRRA